MYTIYKQTNTITNKSYIGLTKHTIKKRFNQHKQDAFRYREGKLPNSAFYNAIRKYGTTCWTSEILEENLSYEDANIKEQYYIKHFNTYANGYNSTIGGDHKFPDYVYKTGENHHQADTKIYTFYHTDGTVFTGNKFQFMTTVFGEITKSSRVSLNKLIQGKSYSYRNWFLDYNRIQKIKEKRLQEFKNKLYKEYLSIEKTKAGKDLTPLDLLIKQTKLNSKRTTAKRIRTKRTRAKRGSPEHKEQCRKRSTGSNNAMWGTTRPQHVKDAVSKRRRSEADQTLRNWINLTADIIEYSIKTIDLRDKYGLNISHLKRVTDGKQLQHKGWTLYVEKS